ncbi:MAG: bifunctional 5,10-methylene-tetrahydrofolate dehydrogenase/5,10-methylene-tetrahydrofolate cyclohydrolase [Treponema sp.]|nr:bifunctional 5,10-methylene-tetrahydrofolate dehydrogenase/5,10-methylene-tetrahydrofolate cyclohydrolase [Treponema sp.]
MAAIIIDGKMVAAKVKEEVREKVSCLKEKGINPCLAVILAGDDPASLSYVRGKHKALAEAGIIGRDIRLPETVSEEELLSIIASLNADPDVHGVLVQHPWPSHIGEDRVINAMDPGKDVDCFHPISVGKLLLEQPGFSPCTPQGIIVLLEEYKIPIKGSHAVVVGRSNIVGKPMVMLLALREMNATVTICHTGTRDLAYYTRQADILIAAAGKPGLIKGDMIKKGAAVIDVGINRVPDSSAEKGYRLRGDVEFDEALEIAGWITPVPGGVGQMTVAMLLKNVVYAAENSVNRE